jgi:hypothetical protein
MALIAWFWLPTGPESAWFFNDQERLYASARVLRDYDAYAAHNHDSNDIEKAFDEAGFCGSS